MPPAFLERDHALEEIVSIRGAVEAAGVNVRNQSKLFDLLVQRVDPIGRNARCGHGAGEIVPGDVAAKLFNGSAGGPPLVPQA